LDMKILPSLHECTYLYVFGKVCTYSSGGGGGGVRCLEIVPNKFFRFKLNIYGILKSQRKKEHITVLSYLL
jgi:hypothetical protein